MDKMDFRSDPWAEWLFRISVFIYIYKLIIEIGETICIHNR